jgi:hypothetical protein
MGTAAAIRPKLIRTGLQPENIIAIDDPHSWISPLDRSRIRPPQPIGEGHQISHGHPIRPSKTRFEEASTLTVRFRCPGRGMAYTGGNERITLPPAITGGSEKFSLDS